MIAAMATEIERKFLLVNDTWRDRVTHSTSMAQGYLSSDAGCSVRVRIHDDAAELNVKSATLGIERAEFEFPIPAGEAREMLETFCGGKLIIKTRYFVPNAGHTWEVDVFDGLNDGLVVAEIELGAADEPFSRPPWLGQEVSSDPRYYNVNLIDHPFCEW